MRLQLVLELDELVEEGGVDILDALNALIVDLRLQVLFRDLLTQLLSPVHPLQPLTFLKGRCVDILLLCQSKGEDAVEEFLEQLVEFLLLVTQESLVNNV